jgi:hypothetical protein
MKKPGFKVVHVQDIDYRSNCQPFTDCLSAIHKWSDAHPGHLPIFILVENKDRSPAPGAAPGPGMLTAATMEALDAEIRGVFPAEKLITPDNVRGAHKTLEEAVLTTGWPTLDAARGKVIFLLDQERATPLYTAGHPTLEGRVMFTNSTPGTQRHRSQDQGSGGERLPGPHHDRRRSPRRPRRQLDPPRCGNGRWCPAVEHGLPVRLQGIIRLFGELRQRQRALQPGAQSDGLHSHCPQRKVAPFNSRRAC